MKELATEKNIEDGVLTTGNFTTQATMPNGKSIIMSGYIYSHNTSEEISKQIDIYHDVVDRQRTKAEIPELQAKLEQKIRNLHQLKDSMTNLKSKKLNGGKLSSAENKMIADLATNVVVIEKDIDDGRDAIEAAKKLIGK
jgi:type II secretory pathway component GspD/PulD (secretin)